MVKGFNTTSKIGKFAVELGCQMMGTSVSSIGNNWERDKKTFSSVTMGIGPINLSVGKGQKLLQWQNNFENIVMNTLGLGNLVFGGKMNFDWKNLSPNYTGGIVDKIYDPKIWYSGLGAHVVFGNSRLFDDPTLYPHELHHLWQSRAFGDAFILNYILQGGGCCIDERDFFKRV